MPLFFDIFQGVGQAPLVPDLVAPIFLIIFVKFVDRIIRQMHVQVIEVVSIRGLILDR